MTEELMLSKLAVTRMSHDLAGIVGAVSNSLELLAELDTTDEESLALARSGAESLVARLTFFRAAYGADGPLTGTDMTCRVLTAYLSSLENKSVSYESHFNVDDEVPLFVLRLMLLACQMCADALVRGGKISVEAKAGAKSLTVHAAGKKVSLDTGVAGLLNGKEARVLSPRQAGAAASVLIARENHWKVSCLTTETEMSVKFFA